VICRTSTLLIFSGIIVTFNISLRSDFYLNMAPSTVQRRTQQKTTMTTTTKSSSLNKSQQVKPFCKVCYDTGKPDHLFSNHFVRETRDPNSRITCPTLLALECRYCFVRGHTVSKCPKLEKVKADGECNHTACHAPRKTKPLSRDSDEESNGFSLLYSSDDENDDIETNITAETSTDVFPDLNNSGITVNEVSNKTYAAALMSILSEKQSFSTTKFEGSFATGELWKKPVVDVCDDASCVSSVSTSSSCVQYITPVKNTMNFREVFKNTHKYNYPGSWADASDSDDE